MTAREFIIYLVFSAVLSLNLVLHFYTLRYIITVIGSGEMAVNSALEMVMKGSDFRPKK